MSKGQGQRAFGRLGSLVIAGVVVSALVAAIAFAASNSSSASQAVPVVPGNPNTPVTAGQIQLATGPTAKTFPMESYSWGASLPVTTTAGGGQAVGKPHLQDFNFTKRTDANTVALLNQLTTGQHYQTVTVTATEAGTSATFVYLLEDVFVTHVSLGGSGGPSFDSVSLYFTKVTWTYTPEVGEAASGSWNIQTNG